MSKTGMYVFTRYVIRQPDSGDDHFQSTELSSTSPAALLDSRKSTAPQDIGSPAIWRMAMRLPNTLAAGASGSAARASGLLVVNIRLVCAVDKTDESTAPIKIVSKSADSRQANRRVEKNFYA